MCPLEQTLGHRVQVLEWHGGRACSLGESRKLRSWCLIRESELGGQAGPRYQPIGTFLDTFMDGCLLHRKEYRDTSWEV